MGELDACGGQVLSQVLHARRAGYRQRIGRAVKLPGQSDLLRGGVVLDGDRAYDRVERDALLPARDLAGVPGRKTMPCSSATARTVAPRRTETL